MSPLLQDLDLQDGVEIGDLTIARAVNSTGVILALANVAVWVSADWTGNQITQAIAAAALGRLGDAREFTCSDFECTDERGGQIRLTPWPSSLGLAIEDLKTGDSAIIYLAPEACAEAAVALAALLHGL